MTARMPAEMTAQRMVRPAGLGELCDIPIPEPSAGLCHSDLHIMHAPERVNRP